MLHIKKGRLKRFLSFGGQGGFTLIELMVASVLSLVVAAGIYSVYRSQQRSYIVREQITLMQQNLRAGMVVMTDDIRMAGYHHPTVDVHPGFTVATDDTLTFTQLKNKDNDPDLADPTITDLETIAYSFDGNRLIRTLDGVYQIIAENIDALDFVYLDIDGNELATPVVGAANLLLIKSVQVTMVARAGRADPNYVDNNVYRNQQDPPDNIVLPAKNDNYRRRRLSREIKCRNL